MTDYQGTCSPQESHQSAAPRTFSGSIATTIAILGNFLWSMAFGFNFQNLWQVAFAFAGESARALDGKTYSLERTLCRKRKEANFLVLERKYTFRGLDGRRSRVRSVRDK